MLRLKVLLQSTQARSEVADAMNAVDAADDLLFFGAALHAARSAPA